MTATNMCYNFVGFRYSPRGPFLIAHIFVFFTMKLLFWCQNASQKELSIGFDLYTWVCYTS